MLTKTKINAYVLSSKPVIEIIGDITGDCEEEIMKAFHKVGKKLQKSVIIDLSNVPYMNSGGISILIKIIKNQQVDNHILNIAGIDKYFEKLFKALGISEFIRYHKNVALAIEAQN